MRLRWTATLLFLSCFSFCSLGFGDQVLARHKQGSVHGFLLLKSAEGKILAVGDQVTVTHGIQVRSRLIFRFKDGSIDDETTVFRQQKILELVSDHHIQKGPSFPEPLDMTVNVPASEVTWHETKNGKDEVKSQRMELPSDLANGLVPLVVENFPERQQEMKVSYVAGDSKPRIVKLSIKREGEDHFSVGGGGRRAGIFNIHIEIGGVAGAIAPVIGKQPSDLKLWVMDGEVPTFVKLVGPLYQKGPRWTMVLTSPVWQDSPNR